MTAARMDPAEDPHTMRGSKSYSYKAFTSPQWNFPKLAPPLKSKAV